MECEEGRDVQSDMVAQVTERLRLCYIQTRRDLHTSAAIFSIARLLRAQIQAQLQAQLQAQAKRKHVARISSSSFLLVTINWVEGDGSRKRSGLQYIGYCRPMYQVRRIMAHLKDSILTRIGTQIWQDPCGNVQRLQRRRIRRQRDDASGGGTVV